MTKNKNRNWGGKRDGAGRLPRIRFDGQLIPVMLDPVKWQTLTPILQDDIYDRGEFIYACYLANQDKLK